MVALVIIPVHQMRLGLHKWTLLVLQFCCLQDCSCERDCARAAYPVADPVLVKALRVFYRTRLRFLPLVDESALGEDRERSGYTGSLVGFLVRERLDSEMADLGRARRELDRIPEDLIARGSLPDDLIPHLTAVDPLPVLNLYGEQVASWQPTGTLRAIAVFRDRERERLERGGTTDVAIPAQVALPATKADARSWLTELILAELHFPLFVTDVEGKTMFFNSSFEAFVLSRKELKNSIRLAEQYFLELTRNLLAQRYSTGSISESAEDFLLRSRLSQLGMNVEVRPLSSGKGLAGYLYVFRPPAEQGMYEEALAMLESGLDLPRAMEQLEGGLIAAVLERSGHNVSHAAKALGIKRTTLQNKIKRLGVSEQYERKAEGPIRRNRRTKQELSQGGAAANMSDLVGDIAGRVRLRKAPGAAKPAPQSARALPAVPASKKTAKRAPGKAPPAPRKKASPKRKTPAGRAAGKKTKRG